MGTDEAAEACAALQRSDRVRNAGARVARRAVRRHLLLTGAFLALAVVTVGVIDSWVQQNWAQSVSIGLVFVLLTVGLLRVDRAASVRAVPARVPLFVALLVSGFAAIAVGAVADHYATRSVAVAAAAGAAFAVWAVVGWWVGR
jgi:FtsH-binding integral membrane protein